MNNNNYYTNVNEQYDVWANSVAYLRAINMLEDSLQQAYISRDNDRAILLLDALLVKLDRMMETKKYAPYRDDIKEEIKNAYSNQLLAKRMRSGGAVSDKKRRDYEAIAHNHIREAWLLIGRFLQDVGMTFRKDTDPFDAWAE